jgi:tetratricopeptide (TPR) repeat protein
VLFGLKVSNILILSLCIMCLETACGSVQNRRLNNQIVNPVKFFVDRESESNKVLYNLQEYNTVSIVGLTNIGKTEIVRKYAALNKNRYDLIWFFDSGLDLNEQFVTLAKKINQTLLLESRNRISEEAYSAKQEVMDYLAGINNWLLVFDNLRLNQNSRLTDLINWKRNGHIIICSQDSRNLPNVIYIHKLTKEHALTLLQKIFGKEVKNQAVLEKLIDIFDGYPGSIVRGALLLKENNYLSLDEYKSILSKSSNPMRTHMELVLDLLTDSDKEILKRISVLNNQNFSKSFLKIVSDKPESVGENLYNLNRFGLIKNTYHDEKNFFEMHDAVRDSVLQFYTEEEIKSELTDIINKLNKIMPQGVTSRYAFISSDSSIKSNLEVLLENAEKYKVDIDIILELRKNLIDHYVVSLDYYNVDKMKNWLEQKEESGLIKLNKISDIVKINYAWYLANIGIYEDFAKSRFISALSYFNKANNVIKNIPGHAELKSTILFQIAQTQVFGGDVEAAEKNMVAADKVIRDYPSSDFDMGLYWFIKARIAFSQGNYKEALRCIDNNIEAEAHLPQDTFTAPTYIQKSEILNFMKEYNKSYEIIKRIQKQEISTGHADHEIHARILTQLSNAEFGLGLKQEALNNANKACDIFQKEINKYKIDNIVNTDFAAALVAKGNALAASKKYDDALLSYNQAESIYFKRYGDNYNKMDDINYLLSQGAKVSCTSKNPFWKKHFYEQLVNNFDLTHPRIIEVEKLCQKSGI